MRYRPPSTAGLRKSREETEAEREGRRSQEGAGAQGREVGSLNDAKCSLSGAKFSLKEAKCSLGGAKCFMNAAKGSLNEAKCSVNDAEDVM
jgi:hypothetical protein